MLDKTCVVSDGTGVLDIADGVLDKTCAVSDGTGVLDKPCDEVNSDEAIVVTTNATGTYILILIN